MYPYFQVKWEKGEATHVAEVFISDDEFDDLVQQGFGVTSEEYFADDYNKKKKAKELYTFLETKKIDMLVKPIGR
jgi:hypothetical protein